MLSNANQLPELPQLSEALLLHDRVLAQEQDELARQELRPAKKQQACKI